VGLLIHRSESAGATVIHAEAIFSTTVTFVRVDDAGRKVSIPPDELAWLSAGVPVLPGPEETKCGRAARPSL
jgi:hypothetical protein